MHERGCDWGFYPWTTFGVLVQNSRHPTRKDGIMEEAGLSKKQWRARLGKMNLTRERRACARCQIDGDVLNAEGSNLSPWGCESERVPSETLV